MNAALTAVAERQSLPGPRFTKSRVRSRGWSGWWPAAVMILLLGCSSANPTAPMSSTGPDTTAAPLTSITSPTGHGIQHLLWRHTLGTGPEDVLVAAGSAWVADHDAAMIYRIDATTHTIRRFRSGSHPGGLAVGAGAVWSSNYDGTVTRIDTATNTVTSLGHFPSLCGQAAVTHGAIWVYVCDVAKPYVARLDIATGRVTAKVPAGTNNSALAVADGVLWMVTSEPGKLLRLDPTTGKILKSESLPGCPWLARSSFAFGSLWIGKFGDCTTAEGDGEVLRVDPHTGRILERIRTPGLRGDPVGETAGAGAVWLWGGAGTIVRYDPAAHTLKTWSDLNAVTVYNVEASSSGLWAISFYGKMVYQLGTL